MLNHARTASSSFANYTHSPSFANSTQSSPSFANSTHSGSFASTSITSELVQVPKDDLRDFVFEKFCFVGFGEQSDKRGEEERKRIADRNEKARTFTREKRARKEESEGGGWRRRSRNRRERRGRRKRGETR